MPRKRVKGKRVDNFTEDMQRMHLLRGWCLDTPVPWHRKLQFPFEDEAHRRECWERWREELMASPAYRGRDFVAIAEGEKPRAWYDYDEERPAEPEGGGDGADTA